MKHIYFRICTIANNLPQYVALKSSFLQAGFNDDNCTYTLFDNSQGNLYDPYHAISKVLTEATEPYVIFCHQDILLDKGDGYDQLISQLDNLNKLDADWAVAGNAGCTDSLEFVIKIDDPNCFQKYGDLPQKVCSLDENFLVIRTAANLQCSGKLNGFHLYATDLCLQATRRNLSCYVIDFYLSHLSGGNTNSVDFHRSLTAFKNNWNQVFTLCVIRTPCTFFYLSRSHVIRRLLRSGRVSGLITNHIGIYTRCTRAKRWLQQGYRWSSEIILKRSALKART